MKKLIAIFFGLILSTNIAFAAQKTEISTLKPGVLTVAVTGICDKDEPHHNCWVYQVMNTKTDKRCVRQN